MAPFFQVMLLLLEEKKKRRRANERIAHKLVKGAKVKAIWGDEENEPAWYEAVVDGRDEESRTRYWVSFPEYGNSACVDLGEIELPTEAISDNDDGGGKYDRNRAEKRGDTRRERSRSRERRRRSDSRDRDRGSRERSSHREQQEGDLLAKVLRDARESSVAQGRNYGNRPTSYKGSLSLKLDRHTVRKRSRSRSPIRERHSREERRSTADRGRSPETGRPSSFTTASTNPANSAATQEQLDRIRKLKERYGDASGERSF